MGRLDGGRRQLVVLRSPYFSGFGAYSAVRKSGAIAATLAADSTLFSMRWGDTLARLFLLERIWVQAIVSAAVTTGVNFDLEAFIARAFTASDTGGTAFTLTGNNAKRRTNGMGTSLITDMRIATTATLTPGTRTLDAQPIGRVQGFTGTAIGSKVFDARPVDLYVNDAHKHPVILAQDEGIVIRNPLAGPATGTFDVLVGIDWQEVPSYV